MTKRNDYKQYIVRKYVKARSAREAIEKSRKLEPDDVYVDSDWKEQKGRQLESCIGFTSDSERDYEEDY